MASAVGSKVHRAKAPEGRKRIWHKVRYPIALSPLTELTFCSNVVPRLTPWATVCRRSAAFLNANFPLGHAHLKLANLQGQAGDLTHSAPQKWLSASAFRFAATKTPCKL